jgi:hypothetical protein
MSVDERLRLSHESFEELWRATTRRSGGTIFETGGMSPWAGMSESPMVNSAVRADPRAAADDVLGRAKDFFTERGRMWALAVFSSIDDDLEAVARDRGFVEIVDMPQMVILDRVEEPAPPAGVELRRVDDPQSIREFGVVNGEAYTVYGIPNDVMESNFSEPERWLRPDNSAFVAEVDGAVAAAALVHVSHDAGCVAFVATHSGHRGRGLGELVSRAATNAGFGLGAGFVHLQASPMGEPIYARIGYKEIARCRMLLAT